MTFRCSPEVHAKLAALAEAWGCSANVVLVRLVQGHGVTGEDQATKDARRAELEAALDTIRRALEE
jgi:hypothetical protein